MAIATQISSPAAGTCRRASIRPPNRDVAAASCEGVVEGRGDGVGCVVDDARIALERVAESIVVLGEEPAISVEGAEHRVGVLV
ncbi:MAG: hypothetical protein M3433_00465 [Actinomycetota bacterium]|nr:hypothetical protein [Actinomycetota bacterium]